MKDFISVRQHNPKLADEWIAEKNYPLTPDNVSYGSGKRVFWKCEKGHIFKAKILDRKNGRGCPYCSGRKAIPGETDLSTLYPDIAKEWHPFKNEKMKPEQYRPGSNVKVWWKCQKCGYEWQAMIASRTLRHTGCAQCAGNIIVEGKNDLATCFPELLSEWNYKKNTTMDPHRIAGYSTKKVWWKCLMGHEWMAAPGQRIRSGSILGCPFCAGKRVMPGNNDLETTHPDLARDWDYDANGSLLPSMVVAGWTKKINWKCRVCGYKWSAVLYSRKNGNGCPYCAHQAVWKGHNDLVTTHFDLVKEWDYEKNLKIQPTEVSAGYNKKVYWKCKTCGYSWKAAINTRTQGRGCPKCAIERHTSFPEQAILFYVSKCCEVISRYKKDGYEIDIFIPSIALGIEYDGEFYHSSRDSREREKRKNAFCELNNIRLIRVKEAFGVHHKDRANIIYRFSKNDDDLNNTIRRILILVANYGIDTSHLSVNTYADRNAIWGNYISSSKEKSLEALFPEIAEEWDYSLNAPLKPINVTAGSQKKVMWRCKLGHSYESSIKHRTIEGNGCPYCAGKKALPGFNDLATLYPQSLKEWCYQRNEKGPYDYTVASNVKVWWSCPNGHDYIQQIAKHVNGQKCPYCFGTKILSGFNDLETLQPELAKEWCYEKNAEKVPSMYRSQSNKKVWWKCSKCGNEWKAAINKRTIGRGCPYCYRQSLKKELR